MAIQEPAATGCFGTIPILLYVRRCFCFYLKLYLDEIYTSFGHGGINPK